MGGGAAIECVCVCESYNVLSARERGGGAGCDNTRMYAGLLFGVLGEGGGILWCFRQCPPVRSLTRACRPTCKNDDSIGPPRIIGTGFGIPQL